MAAPANDTSQRIREIPVLGFHLRANVRNEYLYYFVFIAFQSSFNVLFYTTITDLASQHSVQWGKMEPAPH